MGDCPLEKGQTKGNLQDLRAGSQGAGSWVPLPGLQCSEG